MNKKLLKESKNVLFLLSLLSLMNETTASCTSASVFHVSLSSDTLPDGIQGELRYAINQSNDPANDPGVCCISCDGRIVNNHNTIVFDGPLVINISPTQALPPITQPVLIDGYAGNPGGATPNSNSINAGNNAKITVQINGPGAVFNSHAPLYGLQLTTGSDGSIIRGIALTNWAAVTGRISPGLPIGGVALRIDSNDNCILGCFIGMDVTDQLATNFMAIRTVGENNSIGDGSPAGRNLIVGQYGGLGTVFDNGINTIVQGNTIGLDRSGTTALMFDARLGLNFEGAINGKAIGNVISGHSAFNIAFRTSASPLGANNGVGLLLQGNKIGTDVSGMNIVQSTAVQPNGIGIFLTSETIDGLPTNIVIDSNTISGNTYGIEIGENNFSLYPVVGTTIINNTVGLSSDASTPLGNTYDGIWVKFGRSTYMNNNIIAANGRHGIRLCKSQLSDIKGNWIGTNSDPSFPALGNGGDGIYMGGLGVGVMSFNDIIGGAKLIPTLGGLGENNIIVFNQGHGIETVGYVENAMIDGNFISANGKHGILLNKHASNNYIGTFKSTGNLRIMGDITSQFNATNTFSPVGNGGGPLGNGNVIVLNGGNGIEVLSADHNVIQANTIGTDGFGNALPNGGAGVALVDSSNTLVGAKDAGRSALLPPFLNSPNSLGNIISNNTGFGVGVIEEKNNAVDNTIISNSIVNNGCDGIGFVKKCEDSSCFAK